MSSYSNVYDYEHYTNQTKLKSPIVLVQHPIKFKYLFLLINFMATPAPTITVSKLYSHLRTSIKLFSGSYVL